MLSKEHQANEKYFLRMMQMTKMYMWADKGHCYILTSKTIKPTSKAYDDFAKIVRKPFLNMFVLTD